MQPFPCSASLFCYLLVLLRLTAPKTKRTLQMLTIFHVKILLFEYRENSIQLSSTKTEAINSSSLDHEVVDGYCYVS